MPCFKPALLRLQSKFQNIAQHLLSSNQLSPTPNMISSSEPSLDWSTTAPSLAIQSSFSLNTAHLSDPTTNLSELDEDSERSEVSLSNQPSSNSSFPSLPSKQETLQILTVLHSLISAPLSQTSVQDPPLQVNLRDEPDFSPIAHEPIDVNETFSPHIFDEEDETTLAHSILRCNRLCQLVPPKQCITNIEQFMEGLAGLLESRIWKLQSAAYSLLVHLISNLECGEIHRKLLFSLRHAFRDSSTASQAILVSVTIAVSKHMIKSSESLDNYLLDFDWEGLIHHKSMETLHACVFLLILDFRHLWKISPKLAESIFVEFDTHQHALTRIAEIETKKTHPMDLPTHKPLLEYCLIMSFFFGKTLPDPIIQFIWNNADSSVSLFFVGFHPSFLLNHTSSNCNRHSQPVLLMELLCERLIRSSLHLIFDNTNIPQLDESPLFLTTSLFGLHPLFFRGLLPPHRDIHFLHSEYVVLHIVRSPWFSQLSDEDLLFIVSPPPLAVHFFTQPVCIIHSINALESNLRLFLNYILPSCAPFGECRSLAMIFREFSTVRNPNTRLTQDDRDVRQIVLDLHWLSIPSSFDSPLLAIALSTTGIHSEIPESELMEQLPLRMIICNISRWARMLKSADFRKLFVSLSDTRDSLFQALCDHLPAGVSVALEFLTRFVRESSDGVRMELVWRGVLDAVVVSVSSSSFLEDFENGVTLIGTLLRTMRRVEQTTRTREFDFSSFF
ncbi:hypothetical protein BLNAU_11802 [Blattamonas nauphoetae]|uniref:Uncharacterized protein n=1 Tax=Blattamonas nauphoetae TaxID=2049346 RepID=A0ABQ9XP80_9EUKA|nr:hypothetical protein BLNAU_11802 [Blattamonas nauphoetae]